MALLAVVRICWVFAAVALSAILGPQRHAHAQTPAPNQDQSWHEKTSTTLEPSGDSWIGAEAFGRVASLYSGVTWAPLTSIREDGLRVRVVIGNSTYRYSGPRYDSVSDKAVWQSFTGTARFMDLLAGWQFTQGSTTVKAFAGYSQLSRHITPFDTEVALQKRLSGVKGAIEIWHNWSPKLWTSVDLSASRVQSTYAIHLKTGQRIFGDWSLGPEASLVGTTESTLHRLGIFARYHGERDEFTMSGGVARTRGDAPSAYGSAQYLQRF